jgi:hypothetical protein
MVYHPDYVPMIPRRCDHNYYACARHKVLAETSEDILFDMKLPDELIEAASLMDITPMTWEEWVSRFPAAKQARLRREMEELDDVVFDDRTWNASKLFLKSEFYPEIKPPRPIHSSNVVLNFSVGRWLIPIGEQLPHLLPPWICFPIHADSLEIGEFFEEYSADSRLATSDFSQYDSTQRSEALHLIVDFFRLAGVPEHVCDLMLLDARFIQVTTRKGFSYQCRGLRLSGRSETLLGNTVLTLSIFLHTSREFTKAILVKGDDAVLFLNKSCPPDVSFVIRDRVDSLGFITKIEETDLYSTEFCSSYFLPCSFEGRDTYCLVPRPGKMLAKTFWCKNTQFKPDQVKLQFVSVLKGLRHTLGLIPGVNSLYDNPLYLHHFNEVDAFRHEYNEYTDKVVSPNGNTLLWMMTKYDVSEQQLLDLGDELRSDQFPLRLNSHAARVLIENDWGAANHSDLLHEKVVLSHPHFKVLRIIFFVLLEEILRWFSPILVSLLIGGLELYLTDSLINFVMHVFLSVVTRRFGFVLSVLIHLGYNLKSAASNRLSLF